MPQPLPLSSSRRVPIRVTGRAVDLVHSRCPPSIGWRRRAISLTEFGWSQRPAWRGLRRDVMAMLRRLASAGSRRRRKPTSSGNQELVARSKESGPTPEDQPANPDHQFAPASATSGRNQMSEDDRGLLAPNQLVGNDQPAEGQSFETKAMECAVKAGAAAVKSSAHVSKKRLARRGQ